MIALKKVVLLFKAAKRPCDIGGDRRLFSDDQRFPHDSSQFNILGAGATSVQVWRKLAQSPGDVKMENPRCGGGVPPEHAALAKFRDESHLNIRRSMFDVR